MEAHRVWRRVSAGSEAMKAEMLAEEGRRGAVAGLGVGEEQARACRCSGAIAVSLARFGLVRVWFGCLYAARIRIRIRMGLVQAQIAGPLEWRFLFL
jgi:hypothetical protein